MHIMLRILKLCTPVSITEAGFNKRLFYSALVSIFNRVSHSRIREVGPDRACAEWLMRNGAYIRWKDTGNFITSYNALPLDASVKGQFIIEEIDATDAAISHHGFPHFSGCNYINKIKFANCFYIDDKAMNMLDILSESLKYLEIVNCQDVTDKGIRELVKLKNLKSLIIGDLSQIDNIDVIIKEMVKTLPNTEIRAVK